MSSIWGLFSSVLHTAFTLPLFVLEIVGNLLARSMYVWAMSCWIFYQKILWLTTRKNCYGNLARFWMPVYLWKFVSAEFSLLLRTVTWKLSWNCWNRKLDVTKHFDLNTAYTEYMYLTIEPVITANSFSKSTTVLKWEDSNECHLGIFDDV